MKFRPSLRGIASLEDSGEVKEILEDAGSKMVDQAKAIAPVDTGAYRDSIRYEDGALKSDVDYAFVIEVGSNDTPAFAPLRRAAESVVGSTQMKAR